MRIVAIIPARGGSKRLPRKNIYSILGKPAIAYTIEAAKESGVLDKIIVSTDDKKIAEISRTYGAQIPFIRPKELATDSASTYSVIKHAVEFLEKEGEKIDVIVTLQPNSPLLRPEHIKEGIDKFLKGNLNSLLSVTKGFPVWWVLKEEGNKYVPYVKLESGKNPFNVESQYLPRSYQPNGAIYITDRDFLLEAGAFVDDKGTGILFMSEEDSCDVDTEVDIIIIKEIMKKRQGRK